MREAWREVHWGGDVWREWQWRERVVSRDARGESERGIKKLIKDMLLEGICKGTCGNDREAAGEDM